ncbi:Pbi2p [Saccharomyces paradoxus]|uniref:Pbi2p n=1 Tax=Saccharomyces paradoxus TaxID=27291 RepID=A0A8B8UYS6_SACPA|nr:Pbi2 [Saccharomyces paradoxus]QHS75888.1 Pbi2 [Saccharomyces paradoxus]
MTKNFIVTLKKNTPDVEAKKFLDSVHHAGGSIVHEFDIIKGYTIKVPDVLHLNKLKEKHNDVIENVEEDKEVHAN